MLRASADDGVRGHIMTRATDKYQRVIVPYALSSVEPTMSARKTYSWISGLALSTAQD